MSSSFRRVAAALLAGGLLVAGCSESPSEDAAENPKGALTEALDAFSDYEGVTLVMTLDAAPEDLTETGAPLEIAEQIASSSLTISAKGTTPEEAQAEIVVNVGGNEDAVEMRAVGESIYLRADVLELAEAFGGDPAMIEAAASQYSTQGFDFAEAAVNGEWVGLENPQEALQQLTGQPAPSADPEKAAALAEQLSQVLEQNASVTSEGTDDVGEHLVATVPVKETAQELMDALQGFGGIPSGTLPTDGLEDLPEGEIPIDLWLSDGRLVQVALDFIAIGTALGEEPPEGVDELGLVVGIDEFDGEVEAPDPFVPIDLEEIFQGFFGAAMGSESAGSSAIEVPASGSALDALGLACSDLKALSADEIKAFLDASGQPKAFKSVRQTCPELFQ